MALKQLERGDKDIVNLGAKAAKLAKKAYPEQRETMNRQAICLCIRPEASTGGAEARSLCIGRCCR